MAEHSETDISSQCGQIVGLLIGIAQHIPGSK